MSWMTLLIRISIRKHESTLINTHYGRETVFEVTSDLRDFCFCYTA